MNLDRIDWWRTYLGHVHGDAAMDAQVVHIGAEYGELLQEWQVHRGHNPRKRREDRSEGIRRELADITLAAMITLAVFDPDDWRNVIEARLIYTTWRINGGDSDR